MRDVRECMIEYMRLPHLFGRRLGFKDLRPIHGRIIRYFLFCNYRPRHPGERYRERVFQGHRNLYKTSCLIVAIHMLMLRDPSLQILLIRKTVTEAEQVVFRIKSQLEGNEFLRDFWREAHGAADPRGKRWSTTALDLAVNPAPGIEPNLSVRGIATGVTGAKTDFLICDDIVTRMDRHSKAVRDQCDAQVREMVNLVNRGGSKLTIGTPWHRNDSYRLLPPPVRLPVRETGMYGPSEIEWLKTQMTPALFAANYDLVHMADDQAIFRDPAFAPWPVPAPPAIAFLDTAYSGSNRTALAIAAAVEPLIHLRGRSWRRHCLHCRRDIVHELRRWNVGTLYSESNKDEGAFAQILRGGQEAEIGPDGRLVISDKYNELLQWNPVVDVRQTANKHVRITGMLKDWHRVRHAPDRDNEEFLGFLLDYAEGEEPDDDAEAAAEIVRLIGGSGNLEDRAWP